MQKALLKWYHAEKRALPWRATHDPYFIWLSEIILQQTRVDQGLSYYLTFINIFPDVFALAKASEETVLKAWQGLGYYSRARNLHHSAQHIVKQHNGVFPSTMKEVLDLKGIGPYTAAAILSIAFNQAYPVCDGNVERVVCRYLAIHKPPKSSVAQKLIHEFLNASINRKQPGDFNQAMMELGALVCTPTNPACSKCPLRKDCKALEEGITGELPVKTVKTSNPKCYYHYLVIHPKGSSSMYLRKRTANGIWKNLWDFPLIETKLPMTLSELKKTKEWQQLIGSATIKTGRMATPIIHKLTHRELIVHFLDLEIISGALAKNEYVKATPKQAQAYPVPQLIANYLKAQ